jgi:hypothetical protein
MLGKNKFEKFLLGLSGLFLGIILILAIKIQDTNKKLGKIKNDLEEDTKENLILGVQEVINSNRSETLSKAAHTPLSESAIVRKTVMPKTVQTVQTVKNTQTSKTTKAS